MGGGQNVCHRGWLAHLTSECVIASWFLTTWGRRLYLRFLRKRAVSHTVCCKSPARPGHVWWEAGWRSSWGLPKRLVSVCDFSKSYRHISSGIFGCCVHPFRTLLVTTRVQFLWLIFKIYHHDGFQLWVILLFLLGHLFLYCFLSLSAHLVVIQHRHIFIKSSFLQINLIFDYILKLKLLHFCPS